MVENKIYENEWDSFPKSFRIEPLHTTHSQTTSKRDNGPKAKESLEEKRTGKNRLGLQVNRHQLCKLMWQKEAGRNHMIAKLGDCWHVGQLWKRQRIQCIKSRTHGYREIEDNIVYRDVDDKSPKRKKACPTLGLRFSQAMQHGIDMRRKLAPRAASRVAL